MAEAVAVLGLISSIITCIDTAKRAYEAVQDAGDLPRAFQVINDRMPLVVSIFQRIKCKYEAPSEDKDVRKVIQGCEINAQALCKVFEKVCPSQGAGRRERYSKALQSLKPGRSDKVEILWKEILEGLSTLQSFHVFKQLVPVGDVNAAVEEIAHVEDSLPEDAGVTIYSSGQGSNFLTGSGQQENNQNFGNGYVARNMTFVSSTDHPRPSRNPTPDHPYHDSVPFSQLSEVYVERKDSMLKLENIMRVQSRRKGLKHFATVTGMAATGKTQVVLKYVEQRTGEYEIIIWIDAASKQSFVDSYDRVARDLGLLSTPSSAGTTPQRSLAVQTTMAWLRTRSSNTNWLVVYDNVDDLSWGVRRLLPMGLAGSLIITSQDASLPAVVRATDMRMDIMAENDAIRLLCTAMSIDRDNELGSNLLTMCQEVVRKLEHLPLAIHLAGVTIATEPQILTLGTTNEESLCSVVRRYLTRLERQQDDQMFRKPGHQEYALRYEYTMATAWDSALQRIEQSGNDCSGASPRKLLTLMAFLNPKVILYQRFARAYCKDAIEDDDTSIPDLPTWILHYLTCVDTRLRPASIDDAWDDTRYAQAMTSLLRFGLIRTADGDWRNAISIHSLVRWRAQQDGTRTEYLTAYVGLLHRAVHVRAKRSFHHDQIVQAALSDLVEVYEELDMLNEAASSLRRLLGKESLIQQEASTFIQDATPSEQGLIIRSLDAATLKILEQWVAAARGSSHHRSNAPQPRMAQPEPASTDALCALRQSKLEPTGNEDDMGRQPISARSAEMPRSLFTLDTGSVSCRVRPQASEQLAPASYQTGTFGSMQTISANRHEGVERICRGFEFREQSTSRFWSRERPATSGTWHELLLEQCQLEMLSERVREKSRRGIYSTLCCLSDARKLSLGDLFSSLVTAEENPNVEWMVDAIQPKPMRSWLWSSNTSGGMVVIFKRRDRRLHTERTQACMMPPGSSKVESRDGRLYRKRSDSSDRDRVHRYHKPLSQGQVDDVCLTHIPTYAERGRRARRLSVQLPLSDGEGGSVSNHTSRAEGSTAGTKLVSNASGEPSVDRPLMHVQNTISECSRKRGVFLQQQSDMDEPDFDSIFEVFSHGSADLVARYEKFIDEETPLWKDSLQHKTFLHLAAERGLTSTVELCLEASVDRTTAANSRDKRGATPLHYAYQSGQGDIVIALVSAGADPLAEDKRGRTAHDYAQGSLHPGKWNAQLPSAG